MFGLPMDAVTWREQGMTRSEELLAVLVEHLVPGVTIERPGTATRSTSQRQPEQDATRIGAWFARNISGINETG